MIQGWFKDWSAAPALYVDLPIVDATQVYLESDLMRGVRRWLRMASKHEIPLVLIDTADKDKGRRLLKRNANDRVLSNNSSARQSALTAFSRATDNCTRPQTICDTVRSESGRIVFFGGTGGKPLAPGDDQAGFTTI